MSGSNLSETANSVPPEAGADQVLGLTIYDLPKPEQVMAEAVRRTRMGRLKMLGLFLICAAPVLASYFTYYVIRPEGRRNFGELIEPQRALPDAAALDLTGVPRQLRELKGQWLLISVGSADCRESCIQQLYFQRQLREGLGKDKERLDRVWLINDSKNPPSELMPGLKDATLLRVAPNVLASWLVPSSGHAIEEHLYLVDPHGNWMMRFPANLELTGAGKAKRDLERLMRASSSWDEPGR